MSPSLGVIPAANVAKASGTYCVIRLQLMARRARPGRALGTHRIVTWFQQHYVDPYRQALPAYVALWHLVVR